MRRLLVATFIVGVGGFYVSAFFEPLSWRVVAGASVFIVLLAIVVLMSGGEA